MGFFIILLVVCLPAILLSFLPEKNSQDFEHRVMAELLYPIEDEENCEKCKWLARYIVNNEPNYILVTCPTDRQQHDLVAVSFVGKYYEYPLYSEPTDIEE